MGTYVTRTDVEDRISDQVLRELLDDNVDGQFKAQVDRAIADAESYVESFLNGNYDLDVIRAMGTSVPNEVKRLVLDLVTAFLWDRFPEYIRADGRRIRQDARLELMDLRKGRTKLDITTAPEPARNQGGETRSGDPDSPEPAQKHFNDPESFGIF